MHVVEGINGIDSLDEFLNGDPTDAHAIGFKFQYLFGQGRFIGGMVLANGELHGGITQFANGQQYDALLNATVNIDNTFFWDDVNDVEYQNITWWERYGEAVISTSLVIGGSIAGGLIGSAFGPAGTVYGAYAGGVFVAGLLGTGQRLEAGQSLGESAGGGLLDGVGVSSIWAGVYNEDIITGDGLGLSQREQEVQRFLGYLAVLPIAGVAARGLGSAARATGLARPLSVVRTSSVPTIATTAAPRTVSLKVLQPRLAGGATNPALVQRFLLYQAWKRNAGITGRPTLTQFKRFMGAHRPGSRGVTLYPKNTSGFAAWRRMAGKVHGHHGLPRQFADDFAEIGIRNLDDLIYPVAARHHLSVVHRGVGGGVYNAWWKKFLTTDAYGPTNAENTLRWLELHRQNNFVVKL